MKKYVKQLFQSKSHCNTKISRVLKHDIPKDMCTLPKKPDFSEPLLSKAYLGSGTRETQHVTVWIIQESLRLMCLIND